jgi:hypothetical protein
MAFSAAVLLQARTLAQYRGGLQPILELPLIKRTDITGTGLTGVLEPDALVFVVKNTGNDLHFKVHLTGDTTVAAANDTVSIPVKAGEEFPFSLPKDVKPETVKLSFI